MDSLEKALLESCEEMMRLIRESPDSEPSVDHEAHVSDAEDDDEASNYEGKNNEEDGHGDHKYGAGNSNSKETMSFSAENFTSPFNIRVPLKQRESYYVPGINQETVPKLGDHGASILLLLISIWCRIWKLVPTISEIVEIGSDNVAPVIR